MPGVHGGITTGKGAICCTAPVASPLYEAPADCVERVRELVAEHSTERPRMRAAPSREASANDRRFLPLPFLVQRWRMLVPAIVVIALCLFIVPILVRQARADSYINEAVTSYHRVREGRLTLGIRSNSPREVTTWISGKVPFQFRLPAPGNTKQDDPAYRLAGASLITMRDHPAALITYTK